jgi:hypothetical protein
MMRRITLLVAVGAAVLVATASATTATRNLSDGANHSTVRVAKGTTVAVTLHSTYWTFHASSGKALKAVGAPILAPAPIGTCVPGGGCGTVTARYRAVKTGSAAINASRVSCGEALACGPSNSTYVVHITVTAH